MSEAEAQKEQCHKSQGQWFPSGSQLPGGDLLSSWAKALAWTHVLGSDWIRDMPRMGTKPRAHRPEECLDASKWKTLSQLVTTTILQRHVFLQLHLSVFLLVVFFLLVYIYIYMTFACHSCGGLWQGQYLVVCRHEPSKVASPFVSGHLAQPMRGRRPGVAKLCETYHPVEDIIQRIRG